MKFLSFPLNSEKSGLKGHYQISTNSQTQTIIFVSACEPVGRRIDPSQWTQLQFGLFSVPSSGPQLVHHWPWYVLSCLWDGTYKIPLAAYRKE